jgi:TatD related DNase
MHSSVSISELIEALILGLDFHYMNSPADVQKSILRRQLKQAVALSKPLTIHTREADEDIELILKEEVPRDHKVCRFFRCLLVTTLIPIRYMCTALRMLPAWPSAC